MGRRAVTTARELRDALVPVWCLWHGGHSYAVPEIPRDVERFESIDDALAACESRYANRDRSTPCVDETSGMAVYFADPSDSRDPYPDELIDRGRHGYRVMGA